MKFYLSLFLTLILVQVAHAGEILDDESSKIDERARQENIQQQSKLNLKANIERAAGISILDLERVASPLDESNKQSLKALLEKAINAEQSGLDSDAKLLLQSYLNFRLSGLGEEFSSADPNYLNHEVLTWSSKARRGFAHVLDKATALSSKDPKKPMTNDQAFKSALESMGVWDLYQQGCKRA